MGGLGSAYIAIGAAVESIPPLLMAGVRYLIAGSLLFPVALCPGGRADAGRPSSRGALAGRRRGRRADAGCGNGGVSDAERTIPAGLAALLLESVPLWPVVLDFAFTRVRLRRPGVARAGRGRR